MSSAMLGGLAVALLHFAAALSASASSGLADFGRVMRRWGVDEGVMGGRADAVVQTPDRHLWVGTEEGLFRFNGRGFERIHVELDARLGNKWITRMCLDGAGDLWLTMGNGRLAVLSDGRILPVNPPWEGFELTRWCPHPQGGVVVVSPRKGVGQCLAHLTRDGTEVLLEASGIDVRAIHAARDGRVWVGLRGRPIAHLRDHALVPDAAGAAPDAGTIVERLDGSLLAIGRTGLFGTDGDGWRELRHFERALAGPPNFAVEDLDGRVWFGLWQSDRRVWEPDGRLIELRTGSDGLPAVIQSVLRDADGDLWFATYSGLFQARYLPFLTWTPPAQMADTRVVGLRTRPDGTVWFCGFGGVCRLSPGSPAPEFITARPTAELTTCDADEKGNLWLGNSHGRFRRITDGVETPVPVRGQEPGMIPTTLVVDAEGVAWFTSFLKLYRCDPRRPPLEFSPVSGQGGLPGEFCQLVRRLNDGAMLVAVLRDGVFRREPHADTWSRLTPAGDGVAGGITLMDQDAAGGLWGVVPHQSRLGYWHGERRSVAILADLGLGSVRINGVVADDVGGLWLTTRSHGVMRADVRELLAAMDNPSRRPRLVHFDTSSGLGSKGGSYTSDCVHKSPDGRVWVATDAGLSVVNPRQWLAERSRAAPLAVHIKECVADGDSLALTAPVLIPAGTRRIDVRFAALSFGFPGEVRYRHRLRELDEAWVEDGLRDEVYFQQLEPGRYRFEAMAANRFGEWSREPSLLEFTVLPHWWQTLWFRVGLGVVLLGVLALTRFLKLRQLRREQLRHEMFSRRLIQSQEDERKRLAAELHDSLGQNLLVAKNQLFLLQSSSADGPSRSRLDQVSHSVNAALEEARSISHNLRPVQLERLGLTKAIRAMVRQASEATRIPIDARIDSVDGLFTPEAEISVYRILQEALSNVFKHADASRIKLVVQPQGHHVNLLIQDDGRGFDVSHTVIAGKDARGLGLSGFQERVNLLHGSFECIASPGEGTTLKFRIPVAPPQEAS